MFWSLDGLVTKTSSHQDKNKIIQRDSKRWTQFHMSIFPELYMVYK